MAEEKRSEVNTEMLLVLKITLRFLARNMPMVESDHPVLGEIADGYDWMRSQVREAIDRAEKVRQAEGLEPLELTAEQYQQGLV